MIKIKSTNFGANLKTEISRVSNNLSEFSLVAWLARYKALVPEMHLSSCCSA